MAYVEGDPLNGTDPFGLSPSFGQCLARCTADHYGLSDILSRAAIGAGALPIYKPLVGVPVVGGASQFTNLISYAGFKFFPGQKLGMQVLGTNRLFGLLGRANLLLGAGLLAYDATSIAMCVSDCLKNGQCAVGTGE